MRNNGGQMEDTEKKSKNQKSIVANKNDGGEKLPHKKYHLTYLPTDRNCNNGWGIPDKVIIVVKASQPVRPQV